MMLAKYNDGGCLLLLMHPQTFAGRDDFVELAAAGPTADLLERRNSRTRGSGADEGVRPTFWLRLCCIVGQVGNLRRVANPPAEACNTGRAPVANWRAGCHPAPQLPPRVTGFCETQI